MPLSVVCCLAYLLLYYVTYSFIKPFVIVNKIEHSIYYKYNRSIMASKEQYHSGHDIKSLILNLAMIILFALPFAIYYYPEYLKEEISVMVGGFVLAFITPPYGVLRPHPYSDSEHNKPFLFRKSKSVGTKNE